MHSKVAASEELLGKIGVEHLDRERANRVLIGGLGLGFTLRSVLQSQGAKAEIDLAELLTEVIEWNCAYLRDLNGICLEDPRVRTLNEDVLKVVEESPEGSYDAILLDVDNGPVAMVSQGNASLYTDAGIAALRRALRPQGRLAIWSAGRDRKFETRMRKSRVGCDAIPAKVHKGAKRSAFVIYLIQ